MRTGFLDVPEFPLNVYNTIEKSGSRTEYSLRLSEELVHLGHQISTLPLRYASLMKARASDGTDQDFHSDSSSGERAIVYLTDVLEDTNGPIEFKDHGKMLGKAGTFVHYGAHETHRGCASDIDRYALSLAFDTSDSLITTIGADITCADITCPSGYRKKNTLPTTGPFDTTTCCEKNSNTVLIIGAILLALYFFFFSK
jgi:hypothetical protein